jgi:hypothetical protein
MRALVSVAMLATALLTGLVTFHVITTGVRRECPPPSGQSIENLFAPCLAREGHQKQLETTGRR